MGKASRIKSQRNSSVSVTHEPVVPQNWPDGHVDVALTGDHENECIVLTVHGVHHYLHSTTAYELSKKLNGRIEEWDTYAKSHGALGVLNVE